MGIIGKLSDNNWNKVIGSVFGSAVGVYHQLRREWKELDIWNCVNPLIYSSNYLNVVSDNYVEVLSFIADQSYQPFYQNTRFSGSSLSDRVFCQAICKNYIDDEDRRYQSLYYYKSKINRV